MPRKAASKKKTSVAISNEARQLLAMMAEKSGISQSAVLELAIRERARREKVTLADGAANGGRSGAVTTDHAVIPADGQEHNRHKQEDDAWRARFLNAVEELRAGLPQDLTPEELEREIAQACEEVRERRYADRR